MFVYIVERIEWRESADYIDYTEDKRILHAFLELNQAKEYVEDDAGYYTYTFEWATNRRYVGYFDGERGHSGVRYEIREIPF